MFRIADGKAWGHALVSQVDDPAAKTSEHALNPLPAAGHDGTALSSEDQVRKENWSSSSRSMVAA